MKRNPIPHVAALVGAAASLIAVLTWLGVKPPTAKKHTAPARTKAARPVKAQTTSRPAVLAAPKEKVLDGTVAPVAGVWRYDAAKVSAGGKVFGGYGTLSSATKFATFDVRGWDTFTVSIGMDDRHPDPSPQFDVTIEVDGRSLRKYRVEAGFNESLVDRIATDLAEQIHPLWLRVVGQFNPRGGIRVSAAAERGDARHRPS